MKEILNKIFQQDRPKLLRHEQIALSNILTVAKERLWVADSFEAMEYDTSKFSEEISTDSIHNIKQSIKVMDSFLEKNLDQTNLIS